MKKQKKDNWWDSIKPLMQPPVGLPPAAPPLVGPPPPPSARVPDSQKKQVVSHKPNRDKEG